MIEHLHENRGWIGGWMDVRTDEWMDAWMDGWIYTYRIYRIIYSRYSR